MPLLELLRLDRVSTRGLPIALGGVGKVRHVAALLVEHIHHACGGSIAPALLWRQSILMTSIYGGSVNLRQTALRRDGGIGSGGMLRLPSSIELRPLGLLALT